MRLTPFAGLTALEPDDNPNIDGGRFFAADRDIIDFFLEIGAVSHRHDAHPALANPTTAPAAAVELAAGNIGASVSLYLGYTLLDEDAGETTMSTIATITTPPPYDPPDTPIVAADSYVSGSLTNGTYYYALTLTDGSGGETTIGPVTSIDREPGPAFASITLSGLTADFAATGATGWRLYKATGGEHLGYLASGATGTHVDDGTGCVDCGQPPPAQNRTGGDNGFSVTVPAGASGVSAGASGWRLYGSQDGTFEGSCLLGEFPTASAGTQIAYTSFSPVEGSPPDVSTTTRGAALLDADALANLYWRQAVAGSGSLPAPSRLGEVRLALDSGRAYWAGSAAAASGVGWTEIPGAWTSRATASATALTLASGAVAQTELPLGYGYKVLRVGANQQARVRIYATPTHQAADVSRQFHIAASGQHGMFVDVMLASGGLGLAQIPLPLVDGANLEFVPRPFAPVTITNHGGSGDVIASVTYQRTE